MAIGEVIINIVWIVASIVIGVAVLGGILVWAFRRKKYKQFAIVIWERDGFGQLKETTDDGGIFVDTKTNNKRLFLRKNKVGLNPNNIPYLQSGKKRMVYLYRSGLKNFAYINVNVENQNPTLIVGEEDVNWGINAYERAKKIFSKNKLLEFMPYILFAFTTLIILFLFIYLFRQIPALNKMLEAQTELVRAMAASQGGTAVIPT